MKLRCPKCGQTEKFFAHQQCRGTLHVVVDGDGNWKDNPTEDGLVNTEDLDFDHPEGPYHCAVCQGEIEAIDEAA